MASTSSLAIPPSVDQLISRYRVRKSALRLAWWLGLCITSFCVLLAAALITDRFVDLPVPGRALLTGVTFGVPLFILLTGLTKLFHRDSLERSAGELDSATPGARDLLRTAVNLTGTERASASSGFMLHRTLEDAQTLGRGVQTGRALPWRRLPLAFAGLLIAIPVLVGIFRVPLMDGSLLLERFLHPTGNYARPSLVKILLIDFPAVQVIQQGDDLIIRAKLAGVIPNDPRATLQLTPLIPPAGQKLQRALVVMNPRPGDQFEAVLKNVAEPVTFTISCSDGRSERHTISVRPRPIMNNITAEYVYPRYTQLATKTEPVTMREFKGVEGTRVRINFDSSIPVSASKVVFADSQASIRWDKPRMKGSFQFTIEKDSKFTVQLHSDDDTDNKNEPPFRVRLVPDNVPTVSLLGVPEDLSLYRDDLLNLSYKGSDDFGISEVFIRYHQSGDPRNAKDFTLKSVIGTSKQVAGDFALAIRDITKEDDSWVDIELVMVDSKGQEGVSPAVRLQVISSTPDRQLVELLGIQDRYMQSLARSAERLQNISSRLTILLDGMDDATTISPARQNIINEVTRAFSEVTFPLITDDQGSRMFLVSEYPYILQRRSEDIFSRAATLQGGNLFTPMMAEIAKNTTPRQDLIKLKAKVDALAPRAAELQGVLRDTMTEGRLLLVSYLCSQYLAQPAVVPGAKGSSEASTLLAEKQEERIATILAQLDLIKPGDDQPGLRDAAANAVKAAAEKAEQRTAGLAAAFKVLRDQLDGGGLLDGRLGASTERYLKANTWAALFQKAAAEPAGDQSLWRTQRGISSWLRLRRDNFLLNNAEMFIAGVLEQAAMTGDPGRLSQAIAATTPLEDWSRRADLRDRVMLLRRLLVNMDIELRTGRVNPQAPAFDQVWRQLREVMFSITCDATSGRFAGFSPEIDAGLAALMPMRQAFTPWDAIDIVKSPDWAKSRGDTLVALDKLAALLEPSVTAGSVSALALEKPLLEDMAKNIANEKVLIAKEQVAINEDVDAANKGPASANGTMVNGKQHGRIANGARVGFTHALTERLTVYAVTAATLLDLRQAVWSQQPSRDAITELRCMTVLFEYLSHLEEDVYDKTLAQHIQQGYGTRPYPGYLDEMGKYMGTLSGPIDLISSGFTRLASGQAAALAGDRTFMDVPVRINKQQRFDAQMKSVEQQMDFVDGFKAATTDAARAAMMVPLSKNFEVPTAYWDRVYLATRSVMERAGDATKAPDGSAWAGVAPADADTWAASMVKLSAILPPPADGGDDVKTLRSVIEDFTALRPRILNARVATLDAPGKSAAREELNDWRGKMEGAMRALEGRLSVPALKTRPRARLLVQRADMEHTLGRVLRSENMWTERVGLAARSTVSTRAQLLSPDARPATMADLAFDFSREGSVRRRSAAVSAQASRSLDIDLGGVDESFLKMPKYLYEELRKTLKKPYPSQFKDSTLEYTQDLVKDAR